MSKTKENADTHSGILMEENSLRREFLFLQPVRLAQPKQRLVFQWLIRWPLAGFIFVGLHAFAAEPRSGDVDQGFAPIIAVPLTSSDGFGTGVMLQPDGKILVSGRFTSANGVRADGFVRLAADGQIDALFRPPEAWPILVQPDGQILAHGRDGVIRLNPDGSQDAGFQANTANSIWAIKLQLDGEILVVGQSFVGRLNADGTPDASFDVGEGPNDVVRDLALQNDGKIVIAGFFFRVSGLNRYGIARLLTNGAVDASFDAGNVPYGGISSVAVQPDGMVLVAGSFTSFNGVAVSGITRLQEDGKLDSSFRSDVTGGGVGRILLQDNGSILITGNFTKVAGRDRGGIARLNSDGTLDETFTPVPREAGSLVSILSSVAVQSDGQVVIAGTFISVGGVERSGIARLRANGALDDSFKPTLELPGEVHVIAIQGDGKQLVGGRFSLVNGVRRNGIARLGQDGSLDSIYYPRLNTNAGVFALAVQPDGKVIVGGNFTNVAGVGRNRIARFGSDGNLDPAFDPGTGAVGPEFVGFYSDAVSALALQPDGKVLVGGTFTNFDGTALSGIARLRSDGTLDNSFDPGTGLARSRGAVPYTLALQNDGKILLGGYFTNYNGASRQGLARLNADGSLDLSFDPVAAPSVPGFFEDSFASRIVVLPDGRIGVSGFFYSLNGLSGVRLAFLNADGNTDSSFTPVTAPPFAFYGALGLLLTQPNGKILTAGGFTNFSFNGTLRTALARLNPDGSLDPSLDTRFEPVSLAYVSSVALESDTSVVIGGYFNSVGGIARSSLARLSLVMQPALDSMRYSVGGGTQFVLKGEVGQPCRIDASTNLLDWIALDTVSLTNSTQPFVDSNALSFDSRFYRAVLIPRGQSPSR